MAGALELARRALDELGFYSKALEEAKGAKMKEGSVQQWKNALQKQGVKPAELDATGFTALPIDQKLNRDDVIGFFTENRMKLGETQLSEGAIEAARAARIQAQNARNQAYDNYVEFMERNTGAPSSRETELEAARLYGLYTEAADRAREAQQGAFLANDTAPKFEQYSLPGGANYRENLLTLPGEQRYQSSHWDEPNVLAHTRTKERLGPNGERVLHIDEIQSDWGQQGAREGFTDPKAWDNYVAARERLGALQVRLNQINHQFELRLVDSPEWIPEQEFYTRLDDMRRADPEWQALTREYSEANRAFEGLPRPARQTGVNPGPWVTDEGQWTDLALKRAMIRAEREGYDAIALTPGREQAARYDLGDQVGRIEYVPDGGYLTVRAPDGRAIHENVVKPEQLPEIIGKDNAQRLLAGQPGPNDWGTPQLSLEPTDMTWGGKGMERYYDRVVPTRLDKLARSLDPEARIESMPAGQNLGVASRLDATGNQIGNSRVYNAERGYDDPLGAIAEFPTREEAQSLLDAGHWPRGGEVPQLPMLRLTDRMKEQIRQGLPYFVAPPVVAGGALSALQEPAPMANEFARGGPVRDQREQQRLQDIERASPSEEMLGDSAYRYYIPAYDRLMATRPIGGTDAYRLPPVRRFAEGGYADPSDMAGPEYAASYSDPLGGMSESMFADMIGGSTNTYGGSGYAGGAYDRSPSISGMRDSNIPDASGVYGGNVGSGPSAYGGGGYDYGRDGGWSGAASQNAAIGVGADNGGATAYYDYADPYNYGMYSFNPPAPQMSVGPLYDAPAAPAPPAYEPGFEGPGGNILTESGIGPAPGYNVGTPLGGLGLNFFDPTPVAQQNVDLAAGVTDQNSFDPNLSGPSSQFNAPMRDNLIDIAASTGITPLGSPDDYEDAPDRGFRGMQLSNVAADDPFASFTPDNYVDRGLRGLPSEGPPVDTSMPDAMVGNRASSKAQYTDDPNNPFALAGTNNGLVGPFSPQGARNVAAVGQTEVDVIARQMARDIAREQGITVQQAMPDARAMALQHYVEVVQNRSASFGRTGFGGQTYNPTIEQVLEQRAAFSAVPNTLSRVDGRFPGRVEDLPVSPEYLAATDRVLAGIAAGRRDFPNATHFMNPDESSTRAMREWGTDFIRDPSTVKVAGPAGSSHYVGNPDGIDVPRYETLPPTAALPNSLPSSISTNDRARGSRRADADIPDLDPFATERSIMSELFGVNPAMAQPVTPAGTPAPPRDPSTIPELDTWGYERGFLKSIASGLRSLTGTTGDLTDPANAALPPADRPFAFTPDVLRHDTMPPTEQGRAFGNAVIAGAPSIAERWSEPMTGRYSELGNLGNQPLTAAAYGSPNAPAMAGRNTELGGGLEPEVQVAEPDSQDPAARERAVAASGSVGYPNSNRFSVDPLTGRMYDNVTGDRIINPTYVSRGIDFALGPTPLGPINGLLGLAGGVTGYPLSVGQLMALGRPGTPLENAGAGGVGDRNGNYGSYGEGAAGRDPPGVQSAYRDASATLPAASPSGGGGALSTVAAALPLPVQVGRRYLGEDDDPRTYGMRAMRRYYGTA